MVAEKRIDLPSAKRSGSKKDFQSIDVNSIKNKDAREVGAEWICVQAVSQLGIPGFLKNQEWPEEDICTAVTHLVSRAVHPAPELETSRWIEPENDQRKRLRIYLREPRCADEILGCCRCAKKTVKDNKNQAIELQRVEQEKSTDYYLKVDSHAKASKESSMENRFTERFEEELQKIAASLTKKGRVK